MAETHPSDVGFGENLDFGDEMIHRIAEEKGSSQYKGGLSEDNWEEEIEHIPMFMTGPLPPDGLDPVKDKDLIALQQLKYESQTPLAQAQSFKEDGNHYFKKKDYRKALTAYSSALKLKSTDGPLTSVLLTNRATCHYHLGNNRSAILDCSLACKHDPTYLKCYYRASSACLAAGRCAEGVAWCDRGLLVDHDNQQLSSLRAQLAVKQKAVERDLRKKSRASKKKQERLQQLFAAIKARGVRMEGLEDHADLEEYMDQLEQCLPAGSSGPVALSEEDGCLCWPVMLLYPEHSQTDFIRAFHENDRFEQQLVAVLSSPASWDPAHLYTPTSVQVYYEDCSTGRLVEVKKGDTLRTVLSSHRCLVTSGTPGFIVLNSNSDFAASYLSRHT